MALCFLDGDYLPLADARVSVLDRGFIFGDGVYEVVPAYDGRPFRLAAHLRRLERSLAAIGIDGARPEPGWEAVIERLLAEGGTHDQSVYLQVTRGVAPRRHAPAARLQPTLFAMTEPVSLGKADTITAVLREDFRWRRCDIKATALLASVMMRIEAQREGAEEAILHRDGHVTEAAASNVFAVVDGDVVTPPLSQDLLAGVTRDFVLELCRELGLTAKEEALPVDALRSADEIWASSSGRELVAVTRLDAQPVGDGAPGPVWRRVVADYDRRARAEVRSGHD